MLDHLASRIAPHNPGTAARIAAGLVLWAIFIAVLAFVLGMAVAVGNAHEAQPTAAKPQGWAYPLSCCSNFDCEQVGDARTPNASTRILERPEGYVVSGTGEVVGYQDKRIRHSPDGEFHWCAHKSGVDAGRTICLFVPPRSF